MSVLLDRIAPTDMISLMAIIAFRPGSVICQIWLMWPAPSMRAASYSDGSMDDSVEKYRMEAKPKSFQMVTTV